MLFSKILQPRMIQGFIRDEKKIPTISEGLKKNSFIFNSFQYVSSTLNFNIGEKARKNYIRSLYKSTKNRNEYSLLSSLTYFDNYIRRKG